MLPTPEMTGSKGAVTVAKEIGSSEPTRIKRSRYLRAGRILVGLSDPSSIDLAKLAVQASITESTARHCVDAFVDVSQVLREAGLLRKHPKKAKKKKGKKATA
jgi:hypothetical protein